MTGNPLTNKGDKLQQAMKVATLPKHATNREERQLLEKKARATALAEHLKTRKAVDKLLSKNRRDVNTVDGYKEKAMAKSGTGTRISISVQSLEAGEKAELFSRADADKYLVWLSNFYSMTLKS